VTIHIITSIVYTLISINPYFNPIPDIIKPINPLAFNPIPTAAASLNFRPAITPPMNPPMLFPAIAKIRAVKRNVPCRIFWVENGSAKLKTRDKLRSNPRYANNIGEKKLTVIEETTSYTLENASFPIVDFFMRMPA